MTTTPANSEYYHLTELEMQRLAFVTVCLGRRDGSRLAQMFSEQYTNTSALPMPSYRGVPLAEMQA